MYLVMINGPCGVGKTETSKVLHKKLKNSILVHLDDVRESIPPELFGKKNTIDSFNQTWQAHMVGVDLAKRALKNNQNVIVDALRYHPDWVKPWEEIGRECRANILDIYITADKDVVVERADKRGYDLDSPLTPQKVSELYDLISEFYLTRPNAIKIDNKNLSIEETADMILGHI